MPRPLFVPTMIAASLLTLAPPALGQSPLPIAVDQRVRLWTDAAQAVTGRVTSVAADAVQVATDAGQQVTVVTKTVRRVEVSRSKTSRGSGFKKGALWGAVIMGALGAISLGLQHDAVGEDGSSAGEAAALGAFSGALFGGLIGGGIGAARAGDTWEPVWP